MSLLGALMFVTQLAMSALPNIHIVAPLIIVCCVFFSWRAMYAVFVFVMLEALVWGLGLWVISHMYLWPTLAAAAILMRRCDEPLLWAVLSGVHGLFFGAGCAIPYLFIGGWEMAFSYWLSGIPFDIVHCLGNFVLTLVLFHPLKKVIFRAMNS